MKILAFSLCLTLFFISCDNNFELIEEPTSPNVISKGAYAKLISESPRILDLSQPNATNYEFTVEFVDIDMGNTVREFQLDIGFNDKSIEDQDLSTGRSLFTTLEEFETLNNGTTGLSFKIRLQDIIDHFGIDNYDLSGDDEFKFYTRVITNDGGVYSSENSSATVRGGSFQSFFEFTLVTQCIIPDDMFTGEYLYSFVQSGPLPSGDPLGFDGSTVTLKNTGPTTRSFDFLYLPVFNSGENSILEYPLIFNCDQVKSGSFLTNLGCKPNQRIGIGEGMDFYEVDLSDDTFIRVGGVEFQPDGGCGVSPKEFVFVLTKK